MSILLRTFAAAPVALAFTLLSAAPAQASVIYTYTGNPFEELFLSGPTAPADPHTANDRVTGFIELAAPLAANLSPLTAVTPLSFSFSDGVSTITSANATRADVEFTTDSAGSITNWFVSLSIRAIAVGGTQKNISSVGLVNPIDFGRDILCGPGSNDVVCAQGQSPSYLSQGQAFSPGTWTVRNSTAVPEPSSLALIGFALAGLAARRRVR